MLTKQCEDAGDVKVRSHENFGGCVLIAYVREQEQRQQSAAAAADVRPPLSADIITPVDVPAGIARIRRAREPNRNRSANALARNPTARAQELVVHVAKRGRRARGCERRAFGTCEADDWRLPRNRIARIYT